MSAFNAPHFVSTAKAVNACIGSDFPAPATGLSRSISCPKSNTQVSRSRKPVSAASHTLREPVPVPSSPLSKCQSLSSGHTPPRLFALGISGSDLSTIPQKREPVSEREPVSAREPVPVRGPVPAEPVPAEPLPAEPLPADSIHPSGAGFNQGLRKPTPNPVDSIVTSGSATSSLGWHGSPTEFMDETYLDPEIFGSESEYDSDESDNDIIIPDCFSKTSTISELNVLVQSHLYIANQSLSFQIDPTLVEAAERVRKQPYVPDGASTDDDDDDNRDVHVSEVLESVNEVLESVPAEKAEQVSLTQVRGMMATMLSDFAKNMLPATSATHPSPPPTPTTPVRRSQSLQPIESLFPEDFLMPIESPPRPRSSKNDYQSSKSKRPAELSPDSPVSCHKKPRVETEDEDDTPSELTFDDKVSLVRTLLAEAGNLQPDVATQASTKRASCANKYMDIEAPQPPRVPVRLPLSEALRFASLRASP